MESILLKWITDQQNLLIEKLSYWANINSYSNNLAGLSQMLDALETDFRSLDGTIERIQLPERSIMTPSGEFFMQPQGKALRITKRPHVPIQVLLAGHMDTVYPPDHPFQTPEQTKENILIGPGVADMKGGLVIMLTALQAFEKHPLAGKLGWEIIINPDEETGSIGSEHLFINAAKRHQLGLIFEPSFADGAIVSSRKGSFNFSIIAKGKSAHAGRDFEKGRNAIQALANYISQACLLNDIEKGITINPGFISGGGPVNVVPGLAFCRFNARAFSPEDYQNIRKELENSTKSLQFEGIDLSMHIESARQPKIFDEKSQELFAMLKACANEEGYTLEYRPSGGVCDGNFFAQQGLPVIDTLGAVGGEIHTANEYILIDSLVQRSRLILLFLMKLVSKFS